MLLRMHSGGNASPVVQNPYGIVRKDRDLDFITESSHRLVYTVIDYLIDKVVESPLPDISDVHRRSFPHSLKAFENLDTAGGILLFRLFHLFVFNHIWSKKFVCFKVFL